VQSARTVAVVMGVALHTTCVSVIEIGNLMIVVKVKYYWQLSNLHCVNLRYIGICGYGLSFVDSPKGDLDASGSIDGPDDVVIVNSEQFPYGTTEQFPDMR